MPRKWLALALAIVIAAGVLGIFGSRGGSSPAQEAPVQEEPGALEPVTAGNAEDQLLQLVPILRRGVFGCHQQAEHRLPSPVIRVMHGKDNLLQGNLNFLKKNAMGLGKEVRPLFTAETAKSKAYRKQER